MTFIALTIIYVISCLILNKVILSRAQEAAQKALKERDKLLAELAQTRREAAIRIQRAQEEAQEAMDSYKREAETYRVNISREADAQLRKHRLEAEGRYLSAEAELRSQVDSLVSAHLQGRPAPGIDSDPQELVDAREQIDILQQRLAEGLICTDPPELQEWHRAEAQAAVQGYMAMSQIEEAEAYAETMSWTEGNLEPLYREQQGRSKALRRQGTERQGSWLFHGSQRAAGELRSGFASLMLEAFDTHFLAAVTTKRYGSSAIWKKAAQIDALGAMIGIKLSREYIESKLVELELLSRMQAERRREMDIQRAIREQERDDEIAERELARQRAQVEKAIQQKAIEVEALQRRLESSQAAAETERERLKAQLEEVRSQLEQARSNERAISQAQLTRSGYVYIISNVGSFGEGVFKIGMTRREEPFNRIRELSSASVPFAFACHALIKTEDAPALEYQLHQRFDSFRVNPSNPRKEFFRLDPRDLAEACSQLSGREIRLDRIIEA